MLADWATFSDCIFQQKDMHSGLIRKIPGPLFPWPTDCGVVRARDTRATSLQILWCVSYSYPLLLTLDERRSARGWSLRINAIPITGTHYSTPLYHSIFTLAFHMGVFLSLF